MSNIVIIGSGPAGVSAALYTARAGVDTTVLTRGPGALDRAELIQNYYGFAAPISGAELERQGIEGAKAVGVKFVTTEAVGLTYTDKLTVETLDGDYPADAVVLATGASRATPRIPGLAGLEGHGVSYCATCDGMFYRGKRVAVLSASASGVEEASFLHTLAGSVDYYALKPHDASALPEGVQIVAEKPRSLAREESKIALTTDRETHLYDGVFIFRTAVPLRMLLDGLETDGGAIRVDRSMKTSLPGVFAAGDVTGRPLQIAKAVGEGNVAAIAAAEYIAKLG